MKPAAVQVRIRRLVISDAQRAAATGLSEAIAEALRHELLAGADQIASTALRMRPTQTIARRIASEVANASSLGAKRGPHGAD